MNLTKVFIDSFKTLQDTLFETISSYDIYCNLIGREIKVGETILSPIRRDISPTFVLFIPDDKDEVFFKDFAWVGGNVFKFVRLYALYQEGKTLKNQTEIIKYLDNKLGLGIFDESNKGNKELISIKIDEKFFAAKRVIRFKSRDFTERDLQYWKNYSINEETLKLFDVRSVHKLLNEKNEVIYTVGRSTLTFAYVMFNKVKLYRPEEVPEFKWRNTCPGYYLQGLEQVKKYGLKNKKLIITKSLKDVMVFYEFLKDKYDIIAPHSETYIFTDTEINWMKRHYKKVFIIYDFDLAGVTGANKLKKKDMQYFTVLFVSTNRIRVNGRLKVIDKDISDFAFKRKDEIIKKHLIKIGL